MQTIPRKERTDRSKRNYYCRCLCGQNNHRGAPMCGPSFGNQLSRIDVMRLLRSSSGKAGNRHRHSLLQYWMGPACRIHHVSIVLKLGGGEFVSHYSRHRESVPMAKAYAESRIHPGSSVGLMSSWLHQPPPAGAKGYCLPDRCDGVKTNNCIAARCREGMQDHAIRSRRGQTVARGRLKR